MSEQIIRAIYFWVCAALGVTGALATIGARNPIRGAMGLLLTIGAIAALFLSLHAEFLAAVQLIVYAGAVVVLFLFVLMLLGPAAQTPRDHKTLVPRLFAAFGTVVISAGGVASIFVWNGSGKVPLFPIVKGGEGSIEAMAHELFVTGVVPFELSGALLLVAVVGAVSLAQGKQGKSMQGQLPSTNNREQVARWAFSREHGGQPAAALPTASSPFAGRVSSATAASSGERTRDFNPSLSGAWGHTLQYWRPWVLDTP